MCPRPDGSPPTITLQLHGFLSADGSISVATVHQVQRSVEKKAHSGASCVHGSSSEQCVTSEARSRGRSCFQLLVSAFIVVDFVVVVVSSLEV